MTRSQERTALRGDLVGGADVALQSRAEALGAPAAAGRQAAGATVRVDDTAHILIDRPGNGS